MINWWDTNALLLAGGLPVMMAIGIALSAFMPALDMWNRRYFITFFSLLFLCTLVCLFAGLFWEIPDMAAAERIIYLFESLFFTTPIFMPTVFLLHCCGESLKSSLLFRIAAALKPLVENAVKHGLNLEGDLLHICVRTCQRNRNSEIIVENDGSDFDPADDNEPHIALNNIRQRLEMMCRGKLTIAPRKGGGTVVKVTIPTSEG